MNILWIFNYKTIQIFTVFTPNLLNLNSKYPRKKISDKRFLMFLNHCKDNFKGTYIKLSNYYKKKM